MVMSFAVAKRNMTPCISKDAQAPERTRHLHRHSFKEVRSGAPLGGSNMCEQRIQLGKNECLGKTVKQMGEYAGNLPVCGPVVGQSSLQIFLSCQWPLVLTLWWRTPRHPNAS